MNSELITIAHQDDIYDRNYTKEILNKYKKNKDATIIFTDNYEINNDRKVVKSKKLFREKYYLYPLKHKFFQDKKYFKLRSVKKEKFICTSSITFIKKNNKEKIFPENLLYDNDWQGLIDLAKEKTKFVFLNKKLVGYRVSNKKICQKKIEEDKEILSSLYSKWYYEKVIMKKDKKIVQKEENGL